MDLKRRTYPAIPRCADAWPHSVALQQPFAMRCRYEGIGDTFVQWRRADVFGVIAVQTARSGTLHDHTERQREVAKTRRSRRYAVALDLAGRVGHDRHQVRLRPGPLRC